MSKKLFCLCIYQTTRFGATFQNSVPGCRHLKTACQVVKPFRIAFKNIVPERKVFRAAFQNVT